MRLLALRIDGFGALAGRTFEFGPGLNVVVGANEAGKSTLAAAIIASLYGADRRREHYRPWSASRYATTLRYVLEDGSEFEVSRDFDRDPKGTQVFDRNGADVTAAMVIGRSVAPGEIHLQLPHDVFVNAACVAQQSVEIDGKRASRITASLAQALDGGPRDDAALGAIERLDTALRRHVGTKQATKNVPLRAAIEQAHAASAAADSAREALGRLGEMRSRLDEQTQARDALAAAAAQGARRALGRRSATLRARLADLRAVRDEIAVVDERRAAYDDVTTFDADGVVALEEAFHDWRRCTHVADTAEAEANANDLEPGAVAELAARRSDAGTIDDVAFAALQSAATDAARASARQAEASNAATTARHEAESGAAILGAEISATGLVAFAALVALVAHLWIASAALAIVAFVIGTVAALTITRRRARRRFAAHAQSLADQAINDERLAAATVAAVLDPLGIPNIDELRRRRDRLTELVRCRTLAERSRARAEAARGTAIEAAERFDRLAGVLIGTSFTTRDEARERARRLAARRRERDGLTATLRLLELRRDGLLGTDEEHAIRSDLERLTGEGIEPIDEPVSERELIDERDELDARVRRADVLVAGLAAELRTAEAHVADLAALDDETALLRADITRLQAFERAILLAKSTLERRTHEAHEKFARRLEDYAAPLLASITGARYGDLRVDPASLEITLRVIENHKRVGLATLSTGTREQAYLIVRFAMARMFSEGLETPPLVLDDPFATWDAQRIERCLPILAHGAQEMQAIVLTTSEELASAAAAAGARRIDLAQPAYV